MYMYIYIYMYNIYIYTHTLNYIISYIQSLSTTLSVETHHLMHPDAWPWSSYVILESQVGIAQNYTIILLVKAMTCFSGLYDALWCSVRNMHNLLRQCQVAPFANPLWYATSVTFEVWTTGLVHKTLYSSERQVDCGHSAGSEFEASHSNSKQSLYSKPLKA